MSDTETTTRREPVFIHSLFRAGTTYVFQVFRRAAGGAYWCYQEPLHEDVGRLPDHAHQVEAESDAQNRNLRHPALARPYFFEFYHLREELRRAFRPELSYDRFFLGEAEEDPALQAYLECLIDGAKGRAVLQFCRSTGRLAWMSRRFAAVHLYLLRNPWDQWWSYHVKPYFEVANKLILSGAHLPPSLRAVAAAAGLASAPSRPAAERLPWAHATSLSREQSYLVFYALWLHGLLEARRAGALVVSMDRLSDSAEHRRGVLDALAARGLLGLDLSDCSVPRRVRSAADADFATGIEARARELFLAHGCTSGELADALALAAEGASPTHAAPALERAPDAEELRQVARELSLSPPAAASGPAAAAVPIPDPLFAAHAPRRAELLRLEARDFVYATYRSVLGREPDADGYRHYRGQLAAGRSRAELLREIQRSAEARRRAPRLYARLGFELGPARQPLAERAWGVFADELWRRLCELGMPDPAASLLLVLGEPGTAARRGLYRHLPHGHVAVVASLGDVAAATLTRLGPSCFEVVLPYGLSMDVRLVGARPRDRGWLRAGLSARHPILLALLRHFDARGATVVLSGPYLVGAAAASGATRVVYEAHACEHRLAAALRLPVGTVRGVRRCEAAALARSRLVVGASDDDLAALAALTPTPPPRAELELGVEPIAPTLDAAALHELRRRLFGARALLVFVGGDEAADVDAAELLVTGAAPMLVGEAVVVVMGEVCAALRAPSHAGNVLLLGVPEPPIAELVYGLAALALNPVAAGADASLKLAGYLGRGLPVLTTPAGARGFALEDGRHALFADSRDFVPAIRALLADPERRRALGAAGLAHARARLTWAGLGERFAALLREHVPSRQQGARGQRA